MESHGEAGRIQISDATYQLVRDSFTTKSRGPVEIKGKGTLITHWLDVGSAMASISQQTGGLRCTLEGASNQGEDSCPIT